MYLPSTRAGKPGSRFERAAILKMLTALCFWTLPCWMECEQRVIIRFFLKENGNADEIHRRLQAQFTDGADGIRCDRRWYQFIRHGRKTAMTIRGRVARRSILSKPKFCRHWREPFHSAHSFFEIVSVSYLTIVPHLRDSPGIKNSIYPGCHMIRLRISVVADLKFAGDYCQSWKRESLVHFRYWPEGTRAGLC
jgi:hypothetical protein